jgi:hypothetical protein
MTGAIRLCRTRTLATGLSNDSNQAQAGGHYRPGPTRAKDDSVVSESSWTQALAASLRVTQPVSGYKSELALSLAGAGSDTYRCGFSDSVIYRGTVYNTRAEAKFQFAGALPIIDILKNRKWTIPVSRNLNFSRSTGQLNSWGNALMSLEHQILQNICFRHDALASHHSGSES